MNVARTTLSSKILSQHKDFFANLAVDAVLRYVLSYYCGSLNNIKYKKRILIQPVDSIYSAEVISCKILKCVDHTNCVEKEERKKYKIASVKKPSFWFINS